MTMRHRRLIPRCCWCRSEVPERGLSLLVSDDKCEACSSTASFYAPCEGKFCVAHIPTVKCEVCSSLPDGIDPLVFVSVRKALPTSGLRWAVTTTNPRPYYPYIFSFGNYIVVVNNEVVLSEDLKTRILKRRREGKRVLVLNSNNELTSCLETFQDSSDDIVSETVDYCN